MPLNTVDVFLLMVVMQLYRSTMMGMLPWPLCTMFCMIVLFDSNLYKLKCHVFVLVTGEAWTEDEHKKFLLGLNKLGKGDWRGISRNYVISRTPTQVASHAQKYFNRQTNVHRRKRRSSLFDMVIDDVSISLSLCTC